MPQKVQLKGYVSPELRDAFYELIKKKYTKLHGGLSLELEHALSNWIRLNEGSLAQTTQKINPFPARGHLVAMAIKQRLVQRGFTLQCHKNELFKAIEEERGTDFRTRMKWFKWLIRNGYYKFLNANILEIV